MQGKIPESLASYEQAFRLEPTWITNGNLNHEYGFTLVEAGDHEKARQVFNQGLTTSIKPMALRSLALLDLYEGKYRDAKARLEEALVVTVSTKALLNEARNHLFMSILLEGEGDTVGVQRELDKAAKCLETLPPQGWLSARIGIGWARNRSLEKAVNALATVRKNVNPNNAGENSELHRLDGEIELARGNHTRALELLVLADREKHWSLTAESLARAQRIAGKTDDAIKTYEEFMTMRNEADGWEPQQSWFAAHVDLAKLYIGRKENDKTKRVLQELLTMWNSADADLPLNKEAIRLNQTLSSTRP